MGGSEPVAEPLPLAPGEEWVEVTPEDAEYLAMIRQMDPGDADDCPRCVSYDCAGHQRPTDCGHAVETYFRCVAFDDHRFCVADECEWAEEVRPRVLAAGEGRGTDAEPLAMVLLSPESGRAVYAGRTYRDHRTAKPARTRAGGGGMAAKGRAFLVCARCGSLH